MKSIIYSALTLAVALPLTGCSDFLDTRDKTNGNQNADQYFSEHPELLKPTAYNDLRSLATHLALHEQATDLYINPRSADDGVFSMFNFTPEDGTVKSYYQDRYKGINHANAIINYAPENSTLAQEAKFLRVLNYYYLTQQFGAVPYVTNYIQDANRDYPRTPLNEIYDALLADCNELYNNSSLPAQDHNGNASKQAVAAIAAKIALAAAWDLDTDLVNAEAGTYTVKSTTRFSEAAAWAEKAINGIALTMSFEDKWSPFNEGNAEEIFSVQYDKAGFPGDQNTGGTQMMNEYMTYYGNCIVTGQKGTPSGGTNGMSVKSASLFEHGDKRFEGTFMTEFYNAPLEGGNAKWGTEGYLAYYNCSRAELAKKPIAMKYYAPETTVAEAEADIRQLVANGQAKKFATGEYGVNEPFAAIITGSTVTIWYFNAAGTMPSRTTEPFSTFNTKSANGGTCVKKYDDPTADNVTRNQCYRDIPLLHVSEMYLVAAEAYLMAGNQAASLSKLNDVRGRAGLAPLASFAAYEAPYTTNMSFVFTPLDLVLDERARECYAERVRYHDLRRTKQLVRYNIAFARYINSAADMSNAKGEIKWYRPIPSAEINANTSLSLEDQNPGY